MRPFSIFWRTLFCAFALRLWCAAADLSSSADASTEGLIGRALPIDVSMNRTAGHGEGIYIELKVESNKEGLFQLDTGASITFLDIALAPKLGKPKKTVSYTNYDHKETASLYSTPSLYLGDTRLMTGPTVLVPNRELKDGDRKLLGVLGMDCLQNYCLQFDFAAKRIRFLDPDRLDGRILGECIPLRKRVMVDENLLGTKGCPTMIDTGEVNDGALTIKELRKVLQKSPANGEDWTWLRAGVFYGVTYTNLVVHVCPGPDTLGLRFLARHLVTLNFPKGKLYLRQLDQFDSGSY